MMQQISLAHPNENCPSEKKMKAAYGSVQLHGNNSEDKTNMSVFCFFWPPINLPAPADENKQAF